MPFIDVVHDRAVCEIFRGCIRGCRFCQAGFIYRPIREKATKPQTVRPKGSATPPDMMKYRFVRSVQATIRE